MDANRSRVEKHLDREGRCMLDIGADLPVCVRALVYTQACGSVVAFIARFVRAGSYMCAHGSVNACVHVL